MSGGGSGSSGTYYANQDKLLGAQADIATGVYNDIYQPNAPKAASAMSDMAQQARDGTLTAQARATAGADAGTSMASGLDAATRDTAKYGGTINPNAAVHEAQTAGIQGAALRSGAMNNATQWGQGQAWSRTQDDFNSLQGIPSQSSSSLGSAAAGYAGAANAQQTNANTAAGGLARLGASMSSPGTTGFKDGGEVKTGGLRRRLFSDHDGDEQHLASGGPALPKISMQSLEPSHGPQGLSPLDSAISFTAPIAAHAVGAHVLQPFIKDSVAPAVKGAWNGVMSQIPGTQANSLAAQTATTGDLALPADYGAAGEGAAAAGGEDAASAAAAYIAANPEVLFAALKDGGEVPKKGLGRLMAEGGPKRKSFIKGGHVKGPGTSTSDSIPAKLSDGEFVMNAQATAMIGKDKLNALNQRGLAARQGVR